MAVNQWVRSIARVEERKRRRALFGPVGTADGENHGTQVVAATLSQRQSQQLFAGFLRGGSVQKGRAKVSLGQTAPQAISTKQARILVRHQVTKDVHSNKWLTAERSSQFVKPRRVASRSARREWQDLTCCRMVAREQVEPISPKAVKAAVPNMPHRHVRVFQHNCGHGRLHL